MQPGWLGSSYAWIKAAHVIMVIYWMAGQFMLPRFFAYHSECVVGSAEDISWRERERRLIRIIINPAMIITWILGVLLAFNWGFHNGAWLSVKLLLVFGLTGFHGMCVGWWKCFCRGENTRTTRFYRLANELPTLVVIAIVILVEVKPF